MSECIRGGGDTAAVATTSEEVGVGGTTSCDSVILILGVVGLVGVVGVVETEELSQLLVSSMAPTATRRTTREDFGK